MIWVIVDLLNGSIKHKSRASLFSLFIWNQYVKKRRAAPTPDLKRRNNKKGIDEELEEQGKQP